MTSRECGLVGGNMVRRMIRYAEERMPREENR
ncbi:MAG: small, acid-soluble spore protein, alpha/beta type [Bacillota bacterium]